jgi:hypothetical protein
VHVHRTMRTAKVEIYRKVLPLPLDMKKLSLLFLLVEKSFPSGGMLSLSDSQSESEIFYYQP